MRYEQGELKSVSLLHGGIPSSLVERISSPQPVARLLFAAFLLWCLTTPALAQTSIVGPRAQGARQNDPALQLSLRRAVDIALAPEGNARIELAEELISQAEAQSARARADLLPNIEASVSQQSRTINLDAIGIQIDLPIPGFARPTVVGPFRTFDARATVSQNIFNFSSIRRFQASRVGVRVAKAERESARDQVAADVARSYLAALRARAALEASKANAAMAEALLKLAINQKEAGTGTGIDVTRARVQLSNDRQRLLVARNERTGAYLQLLKVMGLELHVRLQLVDRLAYIPVEPPTVEQAMAVALGSRSDYKAQRRRAENARLRHSAANMERLPSVIGFADYGTIGSSGGNASPTRTYGFSVRLPVFEGGRIDARRAETRSEFGQQLIRLDDLREQIELDIRIALDGLGSAEQQVRVAEGGLGLAEQELAQAERRFRAGVTGSIELTDAQTRLQRARDNRIEALYNYNLARINLGQALGTIRHLIR